jgi:hypothetical protein
MAHHHQSHACHAPVDPCDKAVKALRAQLKAEQETRETLIWAIRNGVTAPEVLEAIADDPVPPIDDDEDLPMRRFGATRREPSAGFARQRPANIQKLRG